jgi:hypothetical protein
MVSMDKLMEMLLLDAIEYLDKHQVRYLVEQPQKGRTRKTRRGDVIYRSLEPSLE